MTPRSRQIVGCPRELRSDCHCSRQTECIYLSSLQRAVEMCKTATFEMSGRDEDDVGGREERKRKSEFGLSAKAESADPWHTTGPPPNSAKNPSPAPAFLFSFLFFFYIHKFTNP